MHDQFLNFRNTSDVISVFKELKAKESLLDEALHEISILTRGKVDSKDTLRRSTLGSYVSGSIQQLNNFVDKKGIELAKDVKTIIKRLCYKADKVLRENISMHAKSPLDVIRFSEVPVRYSYSSFGRREQRWGYGLHTKPFNEDGNSITLANMPPQYTQSIHNHKLSEYCLIIDLCTEGIFFPGGKREKIYTTKKSQILHFSATTPHTLRNPHIGYARNMTFKQALALTDWSPASKLNKVKIVRARLVKGSIVRVGPKEAHKHFTIQDKFYDYRIEIIRLGKDVVYKNIHDYSQYIYVMNGRLTITHSSIQKKCSKNDFIVIDKDTDYVIKTDTFCRLYTIIGAQHVHKNVPSSG